MICNLGTELDLVWAVKGPSNLSYPWEIPAFLCLLELKGRVVASEPPVVSQCGTSLVKGAVRSIVLFIKLLSVTFKATVLHLSL